MAGGQELLFVQLPLCDYNYSALPIRMPVVTDTNSNYVQEDAGGDLL